MAHLGGAHIGTSGWSYPRWRGDFYPAGLPHRDELGYLVAHTTSLEVNATFYALQQPASFRRWREHLPDTLLVALKGSRYITHMLRLRHAEQALANFWASGPLELAGHLGPVLWQLPATMAYDRDQLGAFLELLPRTTHEAAASARGHDARVSDAATTALADLPIRHALEPRHPSFDSSSARGLLREHDVATVLSDGEGLPALDADTSSIRYVRLHGRPRLYHSGYSETALRRWADRVGQWRQGHDDVFVYFDNDAQGRAPHDARRLVELLEVDPAASPRPARPAPIR